MPEPGLRDEDFAPVSQRSRYSCFEIRRARHARNARFLREDVTESKVRVAPPLELFPWFG